MISNQRSTSWILGLSAAGLAFSTAAWAGNSSPFSKLPFPFGSAQTPARSFSLPLQVQMQLRTLGLQLKKSSIETSHGVTTQRFQLSRNGIEILGAMSMTHDGPAGADSVGQSLQTSDQALAFDISTTPDLASDEASRIALGVLGRRDLEAAPELKILPSEKGDGSAQLIYWVTIAPTNHEAGRDILINAHQGTLVADLSHDIEIAPVHVVAATDACQIVDETSGAPVALDPTACPTAHRSGTPVAPHADETSARADTNAEKVLQYYWTSHGRDSFDDQGAELTSVVHVGKNFANAFWSSDKKIMAYGDGDGVVMTDLTRSLDVAGHEMTHGVISSTSQLIYQSQSGALNEAFADYFGIAVAARGDNKDPEWAIGKEIFLNERKNLGLRNLKDPATINARYRDDEGKVVTKPYPAHMKDIFTTNNPCGQANDRCFVHINSMIPGHAMYLMSEAVGLEKAEKLLYVTLSQYLTKTSTFKVFKTQTLKACRQMMSFQECSKVRGAFTAVGL